MFFSWAWLRYGAYNIVYCLFLDSASQARAWEEDGKGGRAGGLRGGARPPLNLASSAQMLPFRRSALFHVTLLPVFTLFFLLATALQSVPPALHPHLSRHVDGSYTP